MSEFNWGSLDRWTSRLEAEDTRRRGWDSDEECDDPDCLCRKYLLTIQEKINETRRGSNGDKQDSESTDNGAGA